VAWRGPEYPGEFPTLGYQVADLIQSQCVIPDGDHMGEPFVLTDEMLRFLLWFYRVDPSTMFDEGSRRWRQPWEYDRGGQLVRPQKWGKGPFSASMVCAEAHPDGPVRFDGWDSAGEPVGRPWATPWIQCAAVSEDQTDNVWTALVPMIELGALAADITDTGLTRINLPNGGKIEPVTSSASSRLGQRITFALQDETHSWLERNGGWKVADTQRRNLAGTGGRFLETTNAWDPAEQSVAQRTSESKSSGVFFDDVEPGSGSIRNKAERRRMMRKVYGDSWWIDLDRIESEILALMEHDPAQAERFFLNRKLAGESAVFDLQAWKKLADPRNVERGSLVTIGVDGARFSDALAIIATEVGSGYQWPVGIWERPASAPDDYEHPFGEVDGALSEAMDFFDVWRVYIDPQYIDHLVDAWKGRYSDKRVFSWYMNRPRQAAWMVRNYVTAVGAGDVSHDGDEVFARHVANTRKQMVSVFDENHRQMFVMAKDRPDSPRKIDAVPAAAVSWEARGDAIAAGATAKPKRSGRAMFV